MISEKVNIEKIIEEVNKKGLSKLNRPIIDFFEISKNNKIFVHYIKPEQTISYSDFGELFDSLNFRFKLRKKVKQIGKRIYIEENKSKFDKFAFIKEIENAINPDNQYINEMTISGDIKNSLKKFEVYKLTKPELTELKEEVYKVFEQAFPTKSEFNRYKIIFSNLLTSLIKEYFS